MQRHTAAHPKPTPCIPRPPRADLPCIDRRPVAAAVSPNSSPHRAVGLDVAIGMQSRTCRGNAGEDVTIWADSRPSGCQLRSARGSRSVIVLSDMVSLFQVAAEFDDIDVTTGSEGALAIGTVSRTGST